MNCEIKTHSKTTEQCKLFLEMYSIYCNNSKIEYNLTKESTCKNLYRTTLDFLFQE